MFGSLILPSSSVALLPELDYGKFDRWGAGFQTSFLYYAYNGIAETSLVRVTQ
jgi:hypothetical protein